MDFQFKLIDSTYIDKIVDMVFVLDEGKNSKTILKIRFNEMFTQNYECIGLFKNHKLIGVCGLWYMTRHYSGKSVEVDHVFIEEAFRGNGLGKIFFDWLYNYLKMKGKDTVELNTYVQNHPSHKFYYNEGFKILGYHFLKTL